MSSPTPAEPICDFSYLPTWLCPHCGMPGRPAYLRRRGQRARQLPLSADASEVRLNYGGSELRLTYDSIHEPSPDTIDDDGNTIAGAVQGSRQWAGYTQRKANVSTADEPTVVDCRGHQPGDTELCTDCQSDLKDVLADIPALLHDLEVALTGDTRFVTGGSSKTPSKPDEAPTPFRQPAARGRDQILTELAAARKLYKLDGGTASQVTAQIAEQLPRLSKQATMPATASQISRAVRYAHRVIDAPPDPFYYGKCPQCDEDITQERIRPDDTTSLVVCPARECNYSAKLADHQEQQLNAKGDIMLPISDLIGAIEKRNGDVVTRDQIKGWIRREGLPRATQNRPQWRNGELVTTTVHVYSLARALELAEEAEQRKQAS